MYDLAIVGGGPAGASAATFAARAGLRTVVLDADKGMTRRAMVNNHLGFPDEFTVDASREFMPCGQGVGAIHELVAEPGYEQQCAQYDEKPRADAEGEARHGSDPVNAGAGAAAVNRSSDNPCHTRFLCRRMPGRAPRISGAHVSRGK